MTRNGRWRLRVRTDFSAAHQLRHYQGKCEALHGHNFSVEAEVAGDQLDAKVGYLMDFKDLKNRLNQVVDTLDHTCLNDLPGFSTCNPTSEELARYIFEALDALLQDSPVRLCWTMVAEKDSSMAFYERCDHASQDDCRRGIS
ncbi:6-carboxytetrahydropterin synthase QueD [Desulfoplanes formicivorans]|uniref:6-carboxy-5,6,7,8-tetrahydropterin synthase n=1 Tax=Desulfoplanes formicivorans TaxID=1592317 RepID=A0A194AFJ3_9BACT|nr:6-carboxytetrahydropterin synthase QueD [Desulfoplanes formicivorans]GAU07970.1 6-pyruvoyl tetrahydrobiopterin synthase [Desulfoplanes formicivorans]